MTQNTCQQFFYADSFSFDVSVYPGERGKRMHNEIKNDNFSILAHSIDCQFQCCLTFSSHREMQTAAWIFHPEVDNKMQQSSDGTSNMRKTEWMHTHNALLQSALLNQTAWKRATLSFQMTLIHHAALRRFCFPSVLVYGSVDTAAQCLLTLHNPEGCPVLCLKHSPRFLFAGLRDGSVMVYGRSNNGKAPVRLFGFRLMAAVVSLLPG